ncbi:MAG: ATP-binding protein [bacterium]|nr:ATP-binding protein [bacterium]
MNPCPCGCFGDSQKACTCAPAIVTKYQKRISGPLPDRIDIHFELPRADYKKLSSDRLGKSSVSIRKRVQAARNIQHPDLPIPNLPMYYAMQTCASGRYGDFVRSR